MAVPLLYHTVMILSILIAGTSAIAFPDRNMTDTDAERANLAEAIQSAVNGSVIESPSENTSQTIGTTEVPLTSTSTKTEELSTKSTPSQEVEIISATRFPISNLFAIKPSNINHYLIGQGTGTVHGVISEALNLAQVAIALFGQSLVGAFTGTVAVSNNSTRLIGVE